MDHLHFDSEKIRKLKKKYEYHHVNVKVVISIGGHNSEYPFSLAEIQIWVDNAKESLTVIIKDLRVQHWPYNMIDGIDINYDTIKTIDNGFSEYMGRLIKSLKDDPNHLVHVVLIAT